MPMPAQLAGDAGLGRALVDEQRSPRRLQQDAVALPDVEERDAQPVRR